ncbi:MAG: ABC transporter permease, partial [Tannerellaceae bacterium]
VEAVCLSSFGIPYRGGQASNNFFCSADSSFQGIPLLFTQVTPGFFSVFRIRGTNNETGETLSHAFAQLASDEMFASDNIRALSRQNKNEQQTYLNTTFSYDPLFENGVRKLRGFVNPIKLAHYHKGQAAQLFYRFTNYEVGADLTVRLKEGLSEDQINQFGKDISGKYRAGNIILTEIQSYDIISAVYNASIVAFIRNYAFGGGFIVLCIFSCVLGIFWYKTQCRQAEIALHKIVGASSAHVCKRLLSEGVIILTVATIPAIAVDYMIGQWELTEVLNESYITPLRFASTVGITYLLMLVMIVVGIGIPAWRAMQIEPAEALHEE